MSLDTDTEQGVLAAAEMGRRVAEADATPEIINPHDPDESVTLRRVRNDETMEPFDAEPYLAAPRRARGAASFDQPDSFAEYVTALHTDGTPTRMWASLTGREVVAVFNDHADGAHAGWRDLTARYEAMQDEDWIAWRANDGQLMTQTDLGEFVEEHLHNIVKPDGAEYARFPTAAEMLEVALTMSATRNVEFDSATRLQSGDQEFAFRETTSAQAGRVTKIEVPDRFLVQASPFVGHPPVTLQARLRYRANGQGFRIGYRLLRPDLAEREAFQQITTVISSGTPHEIPLLWGPPPRAVA